MGESGSYSDPPKPVGDDGVLFVDFRVNGYRLANIDTKEGTAYIELCIVFYWTDVRMEGWKQKVLPPDLWGPLLAVENKRGTINTRQFTFDLVDAATGRMKRGLEFTGCIDNVVDISLFPFDIDRVTCEFFSASSWMSYDQTMTSQVPNGQTYQLREVREQGEGDFFCLCWTGRVHEWDLLGYSYELFSTTYSFGQTAMLFNFSFLLARKTSFYAIKVIFPLIATSIMGACTLVFPIDELGDRAALSSTMFLAAFALLFLVSDQIPKSDTITTIDKLSLAALLLLFATGVQGFLLTAFNEEQHGTINLYTSIALVGAWIAYCSFVLLQASSQRRVEIGHLYADSSFRSLSRDIALYGK